MKKRKMVIAAGVIFLLVIAAVVIFFMMKAAEDVRESSGTSRGDRQNRVSTEGVGPGDFFPVKTPDPEETKKGNSRGSRESKESEEEKEERDRESEKQEEESPQSKEKEGTNQSETAEATGKEQTSKPGEVPEKDNRDGKEASGADSLTSGALQVIGSSLCDSQGNPIQLRGVSTHGLAWFPDYVNEELFRELHEQWNVNVIRLAMYTAEYGGYCSGGDKEQLKQLIRDGVEYASGQNMYVIIDWHILSDGDPNTYKEEAKNFFREMSAEFADRENILYEICNEPNGGTSWSRVKEYAEEIIPVIRENDENAVILVGTPNWCQYVDQAAADPITDWDNIMYTLHFYAATHKDSLRQTMTAALDAGLPIFVSEYGICDASGNGGIDETQAAAWVETMDRYGISYVAWNLSNKNETAALFKSTCNKTSGFSEEDLSSTGKWLYGVLTGGQDTLQGDINRIPGILGNSMPGSLPGKEQENNSQSHPEVSQEGQSPSRPEADQGDQSQESRGQASAAEISAKDLNVTLRVVNSWESEGKHFYQYEMTVENASDKAIGGWQADIVFNEAPELSDSWNGVFTPEGSTLHISSVDYNGQLESGGVAENIGFIISGSAGLLP